MLHLLIAGALSAVDGDWTLYKLDDAAKSSGAVCLDGTSAAYYLRKPLTASAKPGSSWIVFMEGGGWCMTDGNCYSRSLTDLGSSKAYPAQIANAEGVGLYDSFPEATVIYAKYCDGSSFTGNVSQPVKVGNNTIYYRGRLILDALFDELFSMRGLDNATEVLFAGCSAGALTTYIHADYITGLLSKRAPAAKTVALADAVSV